VTRSGLDRSNGRRRTGYQAVTSLPTQLENDPRQPAFKHRQVPRLDIAMVASVGLGLSLNWKSRRAVTPCEAVNRPHHPAIVPAPKPACAPIVWGAAAVLCLALAVIISSTPACKDESCFALDPRRPAELAVAVLPFLDLTEGMKKRGIRRRNH